MFDEEEVYWETHSPKEWADAVQAGCYVDDDGMGFLVVEGEETDLVVFPSDKSTWPKEPNEKVNWYNK